jgi:hypothetical protein
VALAVVVDSSAVLVSDHYDYSPSSAVLPMAEPILQRSHQSSFCFALAPNKAMLRSPCACLTGGSEKGQTHIRAPHFCEPIPAPHISCSDLLAKTAFGAPIIAELGGFLLLANGVDLLTAVACCAFKKSDSDFLSCATKASATGPSCSAEV